MIALLRRLRSTAGEIRAAEWMLLTIETVAVVGGILIAFELEQWATDRREAKAVDRTMRELLEEARYNVTYYNEMALVYEGFLTRAKPHLDELATGSCPSAEGFRRIDALQTFPPIEPRQGVYDELVAGEGLSSLPSKDARWAISLYQQQLAVMRSDRAAATGQRMADIIPLDDPRQSIVFAPNPDDPYDAIDVEYDIAALCADKGLRNRAAFVARAQSITQYWRNDLLGRSIYMCQALADAVGEDCFGGIPKAVISRERALELEPMGEEVRERFDGD